MINSFLVLRSNPASSLFVQLHTPHCIEVSRDSAQLFMAFVTLPAFNFEDSPNVLLLHASLYFVMHNVIGLEHPNISITFTIISSTLDSSSIRNLMLSDLSSLRLFITNIAHFLTPKSIPMSLLNTRGQYVQVS